MRVGVLALLLGAAPSLAFWGWWDDDFPPTALPTNSPAPTPDEMACPHGGWRLWGDSCYLVTNAEHEFADCAAECAPHGELGCISSDAENDFVYALLLNSTDAVGLFTGYVDLGSEGTWYWSEADCTSTFTKWHEGQPNDNGDEDCAVMLGPNHLLWSFASDSSYTDSGQWIDIDCDELAWWHGWDHDGFSCLCETGAVLPTASPTPPGPTFSPRPAPLPTLPDPTAAPPPSAGSQSRTPAARPCRACAAWPT